MNFGVYGTTWICRLKQGLQPFQVKMQTGLLASGMPIDVVVKGDRITVVNNGIVVIHDALFPGLDVSGPIGFQHHGGINPETGKLQGASSLVQFRSIWIQEL